MWRLALVAGVIALNVATALTTAADASRPLLPWGLALIVVSAVALLWRQRWPYPILLLTAAASLAYYPLGFPDAPVALTLVIALYTVARERGVPPSLIAAAALVVAFTLLGRSWETVIGVAPLLLLPVILGELARSRARRITEAEERAAFAEQRAAFADQQKALAEATREAEALRRTSEERLRIARDLHDVLGHQLSLISVQAGAALHTRDHDAAFAALTEIRTASKDALREMRTVLGVLRDAGEPGLAALPELFDRTSATGLTVRRAVAVDALPAPIEQAIYRIVQEALTNTVRHAVAVGAEVDIHREGDTVVVTITDDGAGSSATLGGSGLRGMAERVAALGGAFEAGPSPTGGFRVRASLPLGGNGTQ
jgi:signal transduction histidine kinase